MAEPAPEQDQGPKKASDARTIKTFIMDEYQKNDTNDLDAIYTAMSGRVDCSPQMLFVYMLHLAGDKGTVLHGEIG